MTDAERDQVVAQQASKFLRDLATQHRGALARESPNITATFTVLADEKSAAWLDWLSERVAALRGATPVPEYSTGGESSHGGTVFAPDVARPKIITDSEIEWHLDDAARPEVVTPRPKVVVFCGSSRFIREMAVLMWEWEKAGHVAMGLHLLPDNYPGIQADHMAEHEGVATAMDELHLRKIDLADEVFVVNVGGYIGESTTREIAYARAHGKSVRFLVGDQAGTEVGTSPAGPTPTDDEHTRGINTQQGPRR